LNGPRHRPAGRPGVRRSRTPCRSRLRRQSRSSRADRTGAAADLKAAQSRVEAAAHRQGCGHLAAAVSTSTVTSARGACASGQRTYAVAATVRCRSSTQVRPMPQRQAMRYTGSGQPARRHTSRRPLRADGGAAVKAARPPWVPPPARALAGGHSPGEDRFRAGVATTVELVQAQKPSRAAAVYPWRLHTTSRAQLPRDGRRQSRLLAFIGGSLVETLRRIAVIWSPSSSSASPACSPGATLPCANRRTTRRSADVSQ
jgi:hypothetical protein